MKIFNTYLIQFASIICSFSSLKAQVQEQLLDKETVFREALDKNFGILVSRNQLAIARNNASVLNSGYLPSLTANSAASYNQDNSTIEFPGQFLQDGSPRPDFTIDNAEAQRYSTGLQMNYTLFDGFG